MSPEAERSPWQSRALEMLPGLLSWGIVIGPIWLSLSYPWLLAWFIVAFDLYWLSRALWFSSAVLVARRRIDRVLADDWRGRLDTLERRPARREELLRSLVGAHPRPHRALGFSAFASGVDDRRRARTELADLDAVDRLADPPPSSGEFVQVALIAIRDEPLELLHGTVEALAAADWPRERKIGVFITRHDDEVGATNVATLRAEFGDAFADLIHLVDRQEPGVLIGRRSIIAFGGRHLYRVLVRERGMDPRRVLVTDLEADYRVHPQYFTHLTWTHLTGENRDAHLYRPIPFLHNDIWRAWIPRRLLASIVTQLQMAGSVVSGRLPGGGPSSTTLQLIHEVGYWATDALPGDARFSWKGYFTHGRRFRVVQLFIPAFGDAARGRTSIRALAASYLDARRWARGVTDLPFVVENAVRHREIPLRSRARVLTGLQAGHAAWAFAPLVLLVGSALPLLLDPPRAETAFGPLLPFTAVALLGAALASLAVLVWVEYRSVPPRPPTWGILRRSAVALPWLGLPILGLVLSIVPAQDIVARAPTRRRREARVTKEA